MKKHVPMVHHLSLAVRDIKRSATFYDAALGALGYTRTFTQRNVIGYGFIDHGDIFSIRHRPREKIVTGRGFHLAFIGRTREAIDNFYKAALANGGKNNGGSGLNPAYGPDYYAAFVFDPDGYRMEAVISPHNHH
jgi:catechol 2,3-dioxygenase-like lactoylglutathione lyase family enzyme